MSENVKTPTRPGSKWATGRRVRQEGFHEKPGFRQGALVDRQAAQNASMQRPKPQRRSNRQGGEL